MLNNLRKKPKDLPAVDVEDFVKRLDKSCGITSETKSWQEKLHPSRNFTKEVRNGEKCVASVSLHVLLKDSL